MTPAQSIHKAAQLSRNVVEINRFKVVHWILQHTVQEKKDWKKNKPIFRMERS